MNILASYINRQSRNNLIFCSKEVEGISYVDIGRQLAEEIENCMQKKRLAMIADDALRKILRQGFYSNEDIGDYLAITNIGILFEPALHLDVKAILKSWSRDYVLIVKHEGVIRDDVFYLSDKTAKYFVNLNDITHKIILQ